MSFYEKSAWVMMLTLLATALWYFFSVSQASTVEVMASPSLLSLIAVVVVQVVVIAVAHAVIAIMKPKEANRAFDEREQQIAEKAAHAASLVMNAGVAISLAVYLVFSSGDMLFYSVLLSLYAGALMNYAARVYLYRRAVY
ncbi:hypothetical protein [Alteromonas sp. CYL-A6]|uniref:hypothetical protein n=1 Tax=Alteromonas nitratireducens TaxID=3390813 RepID=UPI0034BDAE43